MPVLTPHTPSYPRASTTFRAAWWLPGPHLPTLWGKLARRRPRLATTVERWLTPDDDWLAVHRLAAAPGAPRVLILHGLEGSARSHYAMGMLAEARRRGWEAAVLQFRSCGGALNEQPRFYHSGETTDLALVVRRMAREAPGVPLGLIGVSLGGNVLLKWLGEAVSEMPPEVHAAAAVSVPFDLGRGARHIDRGFSRVYQAHFLRSLRRKALQKLERFPGLFDRAALDAARTLADFDDAVTAPVHGFAGADDYYVRSSSLRFLNAIRRPTLLLAAVDDPFLPAVVLDEVRAIANTNPALTLEFHPHGGHAGFVGGGAPWRAVYHAERRALDFLTERLPAERPSAGLPAAVPGGLRHLPDDL
ncbi:MAG TPA: alpha/beta fold hydrolase [Gemmatimonadaceae bacterium]|nr:alpha/beta fold hydrolase [Gemmatimonadaceae bacterium]